MPCADCINQWAVVVFKGLEGIITDITDESMWMIVGRWEYAAGAFFETYAGYARR